MSTRPDAGLTLIEMVVAIVLTAILMAMAAPLLTHLVRSYVTGAQGADLATAAGPAVARMQWDGRNAYQMVVTNTCTLDLKNAKGQILEDYHYAGGRLYRDKALILGDLQSPGGACPFRPYRVVRKRGIVAVGYDFLYTGPSGQGHLAVDGVLSAYAYF
ncbi:prepilin-type N-terminal cleavage/methylation domain-containing protein [Acidiferrobacter sp.]|uniref:pilus assembly FimT family protein n=1 Tax=Acidiferrobacter sp. TaxID=1872107 RepID=UPI002606DF7D|nr:prepilin-type N-terminal cleavage/methylation domain-containing protein [Acidiferrobacter sp.]